MHDGRLPDWLNIGVIVWVVKWLRLMCLSNFFFLCFNWFHFICFSFCDWYLAFYCFDFNVCISLTPSFSSLYFATLSSFVCLHLASHPLFLLLACWFPFPLTLAALHVSSTHHIHFTSLLYYLLCIFRSLPIHCFSSSVLVSVSSHARRHSRADTTSHPAHTPAYPFSCSRRSFLL